MSSAGPQPGMLLPGTPLPGTPSPGMPPLRFAQGKGRLSRAALPQTATRGDDVSRRTPRAKKGKGRDYIIRGGFEGRERLRVLSRVMQPSTLNLFHRVGVRPGMECLDVGSGGGDVAFDLARLVAPGGRVVGMDIDEIKLGLARREARAHHLANVEFLLVDIAEREIETEFDFVYSRFVLTHLRDPEGAVAKMYKALRPGAVLSVVDIDFRGYFCHPDCGAFRRYIGLYTETVGRRGGDANLGPRLPELLTRAGFRGVQMNVVQPAGMDGEVKLLTPITMENIADAVMAEGLASRKEIGQIVAALYKFAQDPSTVMSAPRIVEAWGYRPRA